NETEFAALISRLPGCDRDFHENEIVKMSANEVHSLCRMLGPRIVLVTLGERGCLISLPDGVLALPALSGVTAGGTTRAGDAFFGAFAAAWLEFAGDAERAARFANAAAGLSVQKRGAAPSMPHRAEIDAASDFAQTVNP